jgi:hypothetical protein
MVSVNSFTSYAAELFRGLKIVTVYFRKLGVLAAIHSLSVKVLAKEYPDAPCRDESVEVLAQK